LIDGIKTCIWYVTVPVGVPAVELSIVNMSLLVEWSLLPPELARGRITMYKVLLRQAHTAEQPLITTVENALQHFVDGMVSSPCTELLLRKYRQANVTANVQ